MKKIVIIGNSLAGVRAAEIIQSKEPSWEIIFVLFEEHNPYNKDLFSPFVAQEIIFKDILEHKENFYNTNNIKILHCSGLHRINVRKQLIVTKEKEQISYDQLVLTDLPGQKFPSIKGTLKKGVFNFKRLEDVIQVEKNIDFVDSVTIQSDFIEGLQLAFSLLKRGKEVNLVSSSQSSLLGVLGRDRLTALLNTGHSESFNFFVESSISEILGEGDVKAVRLDAKKVIASEMVIFCDPQPDYRLIFDSVDALPKDIKVSPYGCVIFENEMIENVWVLDYLNPMDSISSIKGQPSASLLERQGRRLGQYLTGQEDLEETVVNVKVPFNDQVLLEIGETTEKENITIQEFESSDGDYKRFFIKESVLKGAILLNDERSQDVLIKIIKEKTPVAETELNWFRPFNSETSEDTTGLVEQDQTQNTDLTLERNLAGPEDLESQDPIKGNIA